MYISGSTVFCHLNNLDKFQIQYHREYREWKSFCHVLQKNQKTHHFYQPVKIKKCGETPSNQKESLILLCLIFLPVGKSLRPFLYVTFVHLNNIYAGCHKRDIRQKKMFTYSVDCPCFWCSSATTSWDNCKRFSWCKKWSLTHVVPNSWFCLNPLLAAAELPPEPKFPLWVEVSPRVNCRLEGE